MGLDKLCRSFMESPIIAISNKNEVFPLDSMTETLNLVNNNKPKGLGAWVIYRRLLG